MANARARMTKKDPRVNEKNHSAAFLPTYIRLTWVANASTQVDNACREVESSFGWGRERMISTLKVKCSIWEL